MGLLDYNCRAVRRVLSNLSSLKMAFETRDEDGLEKLLDDGVGLQVQGLLVNARTLSFCHGYDINHRAIPKFRSNLQHNPSEMVGGD